MTIIKKKVVLYVVSLFKDLLPVVFSDILRPLTVVFSDILRPLTVVFSDILRPLTSSLFRYSETSKQ